MSALSVRTPNEKERQAYVFERLRERLQSLARTVSGRFEVNVHWTLSKPATDGRAIQLNPTIEYEEARLLSPKWWVTQKATAAHEAFHVATTDMAAYRSGIEALVREAKLSPKMAQLVANCGEDARIEYHGKQQWIGIRLWLEYANDLAFRAHEEKIASARPSEAAAKALMLAIVVGRMPKGTPPEAKDAITKLMPLIERIRRAETTADGMRLALELARALPPIFRKAPPDTPIRLLGTPIEVPLPSGPLDDEPGEEMDEEGEGAGDGDDDAADDDGPEASDAGDASPDPGDDDSGDEDEGIEEDAEAGAGEGGADAPPEDDDDDDGEPADDDASDEPTPLEEGSEPDGGDTAAEEDEDSETAGSTDDDDGELGDAADSVPEGEGDESPSPEDDASDTEGGTEGTAGPEESEAGDDAGDESAGASAAMDGPMPDLTAEFESLLEEAGSELEAADADALTEARSRPLSPEEIAEGSGDGSVGFVEMKVGPKETDIFGYAQALYETTALRERFYRTLLQTLRPPRPEPHTGSKRGRLDVGRAWRAPAFGDLSVFERKTAQPSLKGVAVYLLIDNSGSMGSPAEGSSGRPGGSEPKTRVARRAAVVLSDALRRVGVAHTAVGFTEKRERVLHLRFVAWDDQSQEGQAGLGAITDIASNRDGYSIGIATAELLQRREETKILLVLSDGMPAANHYGGRAAVEDTARAVREATRKGVLLAGLFFGDDTPRSIADASYMYPDLACLFGDISYLPEVVGNTVVRLLRRAAIYG